MTRNKLHHGVRNRWIRKSKGKRHLNVNNLTSECQHPVPLSMLTPCLRTSKFKRKYCRTPPPRKKANSRRLHSGGTVGAAQWNWNIRGERPSFLTTFVALCRSPHSLNASNKLRHPVIIQTPAPANEWRSVLHYYLKGDAINANDPLCETILYHIEDIT